jgi:hypothetical protein
MPSGAEFYGLAELGLPDPGPAAPPKVTAPRRVYVQKFVAESYLNDRAYLMARFSERAMRFFAEQPGLDWKTVEFRVVNNGSEPRPGEAWRWEAWVA